ncbi:C-C chemokine receptor type 6 [Mixophyes fleayi]|uniref:C-C chemokine receptor type 6 n=1 Tax=Mixophyes fleayi TaxID=3061075 RepID=UPI003F4E2BA0
MSNFTPSTDYFYHTDFSSEETVCRMDTVKEFLKVFVPVTFSFIFVFGLVGNILVVITFSRYKKEKNMTDVFLLNMAIADILLIFTLPFWALYYYYKQDWIFEDFMCKLVRSIYAINFNCSMLLLACVGIDRYVAIVQVTKSFRFRNIALAYKRVLCLSVWIMSACLSTITYVFTECYKLEGDQSMVCEARYSTDITPLKWKLAAIIVEVGVGFLIPFLIMLFCYTSIIKTLLQAKNSQRHKAIHVIVAVVAVFLFCQVPYNVLLLAKASDLMDKRYCSKIIKHSYALSITKALAFFHCCLNPVIYAFIGVKFRNYFVKIMQDIWCMRKLYRSRTRLSRLSSDMYTSRRTSEVFTSEGGSSFTM